MSWLENGSFKFGNIDMYETFGIQILDDSMEEDLLLPEVRTRKVTIPLRHGEYDFGSKYRKNRPLTMNCVSTRFTTEGEFRDYAREIAYVLSKKNEIRRWNEPDKYYIGKIEKEITLIQIRDVGNVFTLEFTCEPFAYGETKTEQFVRQGNSLVYNPNYRGTEDTPTYIEIVNTGSTASVVNIRISQIDRKDTY